MNKLRVFIFCLTSLFLLGEFLFADVVGRYVVQETDDTLWFVGEIVDETIDLDTNSEGGLNVERIVVFSLNRSGQFKIKSVKKGEHDKWLPILTWNDELPVLVSDDAENGLLIYADPTMAERKIDWALRKGEIESWRHSGEFPRLVAERNRKHFGVLDYYLGGAMGAAMGKKLEFKGWTVLMGSKPTDLNCNSMTIKPRGKVADSSVSVLVRLDF